MENHLKKDTSACGASKVLESTVEPDESDVCLSARLLFPWKLYEILNQAEDRNYSDIISWLPCGTAFRVHNQSAFVEKIMPTCFNQTKFDSFHRQREFNAMATFINGLAFLTKLMHPHLIVEFVRMA